ncbi:putative uncharacterized protein [Meiothermus ruber H328]|jgi:methionine-rich copper-binding protein CopC|nr:putative uncharacterized protein [Meiothermus ruber H328]
MIAATLALAGVAHAHAYLVNSSPVENVLLRRPPGEVRLSFTEAVELRFSQFAVYALEVPNERWREAGWLQEQAKALAEKALSAGGVKPAGRVDAGLKTRARTAENVVIALRPGLGPGVYVVLWRVLSVDSHTTQGFFVFVVEP